MRKNLSIMLVDDEIGALTIIGIMLERAGFDVLKARSVENCLEMLEVCEPDILLTDLMMPGRTGIDLIGEVRQLPRYANLPIILMVSRGDSDSVIEGTKAGANDYLTKPLLSYDLLAKLDEVLDKYYPETFPPNCALLLHGDYPDVNYVRQLCQAIAARVPVPLIALPSRADETGRSRNLVAAMRASRSLTICVSDESIGRDYIRTAYDYFAGHDKPMTAILFDEVELPDVFNTRHVFTSQELEVYCAWLARVHAPRPHRSVR